MTDALAIDALMLIAKIVFVARDSLGPGADTA